MLNGLEQDSFDWVSMAYTFGDAKAPGTVLATFKERMASNSLEPALHGEPRVPFNMTGHVAGRPFSVHAEGC